MVPRAVAVICQIVDETARTANAGLRSITMCSDSGAQENDGYLAHEPRRLRVGQLRYVGMWELPGSGAQRNCRY